MIHILMTNKSEELYSACVRKILENFPNFKPNIAMSDFEDAPRNAFRNYFPGIEITGCLFHYTQAIWARLRKVELSSLYRTNQEFNTWFRCILALPLLPQEEIPSMFKVLEEQILEISHTEKLNFFLKYVKKQWVVKEKSLSVYATINTTNNGAETYH